MCFHIPKAVWQILKYFAITIVKHKSLIFEEGYFYKSTFENFFHENWAVFMFMFIY